MIPVLIKTSTEKAGILIVIHGNI